MIRFIDLGDQIIDDCNEFAFYDTTIDKFREFQGIQTWSSIEDFKSDYDGDELDRYLRLIPKDWENS
jgi:hypothetical protein